MKIKDSGNRREFSTGAVRDINEDKGRCDLLPLDIVGEVMSDSILVKINSYIRTGYRNFLIEAFKEFSITCYGEFYTAILEVSKHYADGCQKYGERNWEKGIPLHCFIDSGVRHYIKWLRGDTDEAHDRAFLWNLLGALWTYTYHPDLCDLPFKNKEGIV